MTAADSLQRHLGEVVDDHRGAVDDGVVISALEEEIDRIEQSEGHHGLGEFA